jgi:hypothetical protein
MEKPFDQLHYMEMEPGGSIPSRAGCLELVRIHTYTGSTKETTYDCVCLRCGAAHVMPRPKLQGMIATVRRRHEAQDPRWWLSIYGSCPKCPPVRGHEKARPNECITKERFFRAALSLHGLQIRVVTRAGGNTSVAITDSGGKVASLCNCALPHEQKLSTDAIATTEAIQADCEPSRAVVSFLEWANRGNYTYIKWGDKQESFCYCACFGAPPELPD